MHNQPNVWTSALSKFKCKRFQALRLTSCLGCMTCAGSLFQQHMVYGLDTMVRLCNGAVTSGDTPLLADILALLVCEGMRKSNRDQKRGRWGQWGAVLDACGLIWIA
eukprot:scaffold28114_cov19-Tisochrysis_lutea.AAC.1